ncbi:hypothetical protein ACFVVU_00575 [Kitasatospora sp. NPDC057965]|uniref:hypothetical protein n=1 Tax=Kitasatospora sp. NPDC057965 TaxID=3346291 RepID=UPI0036DA5FA8
MVLSRLTLRGRGGGENSAPAQSDSVSAWGGGRGADVIGRLTYDGDPDRWPVLVRERHAWPHWWLYDCGMAEFLRRLFTRDFDQCPLGDASLWGDPSPHFVHWREARRRFESGVDPFTGEPLPWSGRGFA